MSKHKSIVFTGGGTSGHVVPCLPIMEALQKEDWRIEYIGSVDGPEAEIVKKVGFNYHGISTERLRRFKAKSNLMIPFRVTKGIWQAWRLLGKFKPDVVFSKGGFVSVPVVLAARMRRISVVAHESDLSPGLTNRLSAPFVKRMCFTLPLSFYPKLAVPKARAVTTGIPLRDDFIHANPALANTQFGLLESEQVLVVFGGGNGAQSINEAVREALPELTKQYHVVHLCGKNKADESFNDRRNYQQHEYVSEGMAHLLKRADALITRAGMTTIIELIALNQTAVLVPLPLAQSRGDQIENASLMRKHHLFLELKDEGLSTETILASLQELQQSKTRLQANQAKLELGFNAKSIVREIKNVVADNNA